MRDSAAAVYFGHVRVRGSFRSLKTLHFVDIFFPFPSHMRSSKPVLFSTELNIGEEERMKMDFTAHMNSGDLRSSQISSEIPGETCKESK